MTDTDQIDIHPVTDACFDEERPRLLNASDVPIVFGLDAYKRTLAKLVAKMREPARFADLGPDPDSPLIVRGHALEDDAVDEIQKLRKTWQISLNQNHFVNHQHRIACIPDALVTDPARDGIGSLQIKVVSAPVFRKTWGDGPPLGHMLQLSQEMMLIPGCTWGAIGALVHGDFTWAAYVYEIDRNRKAEIRMLTAAADFWRAFDAGDHPVIDFSRDGDLIALMYPAEIPGKVVDLSTDNVIGELLQRREILRDTATDIDKRLKATETEIKAKLGDAEAALVNGWRVTLKSQTRKAHQVAESTYRVLRATRDGQEKRAQSN